MNYKGETHLLKLCHRLKHQKLKHFSPQKSRSRAFKTIANLKDGGYLVGKIFHFVSARGIGFKFGMIESVLSDTYFTARHFDVHDNKLDAV
jgi:hypothetical protein